MTRKEAIKLGSMAVRCVAHNDNLGNKENYDTGYHIGKFLAYIFAASMYSVEEVGIFSLDVPWRDELAKIKDSPFFGRVVLYPKLNQVYDNKFIWFLTSKNFFEDVLKDVEKEQGKPLVEDIRKNCVICE